MTLVEIMMAIAIIVLVTATLAVAVNSSREAAYQSAAVLTMGKIDSAIQTYTIRYKKPPTTSEGLKAVFKLGNERVPEDPWGNEFVYTSPGPGGAPYDIMSYGRDGKKGGDDDIIWTEEKNR